MNYSATADNLRQKVAETARVLRSAAADLERYGESMLHAQSDFIQALNNARNRRSVA